MKMQSKSGVVIICEEMVFALLIYCVEIVEWVKVDVGSVVVTKNWSCSWYQ